MIIVSHETLGSEDYTLIFEVIFVCLFLFSVFFFFVIWMRMTFHFEYPSLNDSGKLMSLSIKQLCILQEQT